jgi:hypothetical protein
MRNRILVRTDHKPDMISDNKRYQTTSDSVFQFPLAYRQENGNCCK